MMKKMRSMLAIGLSAVLALSCLSACGSGGNETTAAPTSASTETTAAAETTAAPTSASTETTAAADTTAAPETTAEAVEEPVYNFNGGEVVLSTWDSGVWDLEGENRSAQVHHARMEEMEEKYNCKFVFKQTNGSYIINDIRAGEMAGIPFADVVAVSASTAISAYNNGFLMEVSQLFGDKFYSPSYDYIKKGDGTYYTFIPGDYTPNPDDPVTYGGLGNNVFAFNKDLFESRGIDVDALYQDVLDGNWTWDRFIEIADQAAVITDGVVEVYGGEVYYARRRERFGAYLASFGASVMTRNADGTVTSELHSENLRTAMEKLIDMSKHESVWHQVPGDSWDTNIKMFEDGQIGMIIANGQWKQIFRESDFEVGYLPMPKANAEDEYVKFTEEMQVRAFPASGAKDMDRVQAIADMLMYIYQPVEGVKNVDEDEIAIYCTDEQSIQIIENFYRLDINESPVFLCGLDADSAPVFDQLYLAQNGEASYDAAIDACADAWQALLDEYNAALEAQ